MPYLNELYYADEGSGPSILFIHCPALSHHYWNPIVVRLASQFRCISIDVRGHGRSTMGHALWRTADIAADLQALADHLQLERPALVGYSAGGSIALETALAAPDRFGRLCMVSSFSECSGFYLPGEARLGVAAVRGGLTALTGQLIAVANRVDRKHLRAMLPDARAVHPAGLLSFLIGVLECSLTPLLPTLPNPTLLVYGSRDLPMHRYGRILRDGLPNSRLSFLPGTGHRVPSQVPDLFSGMLEGFLTT